MFVGLGEWEFVADQLDTLDQVPSNTWINSQVLNSSACAAWGIK